MKASTVVPKKQRWPTLKFFAGLWTLRNYPSRDREWTLAAKFAEVRHQGFEAVGGRFEPDAPRLCQELGLDYILYIDASAADYGDMLKRAGAWQPSRINVQLGEHDTKPREAARMWMAMMKMAGDLGLKIDLELHRDTSTETVEKSLEIAERYQDATGEPIRFSLDFSHFAVGKHLAPPFAARLLDKSSLIQSARQFHFRPFNGHHAQVPLTDGRGELTPEAMDWLVFAEELLYKVRAAGDPDEIYYACPENGPLGSGYALSGFPDVWLDAVRTRDELRRIWKSLRPVPREPQ